MESKQSHQRAVILAKRIKDVVSIIPENIEATTRKKPGYLVNVVLPSLMRFNENCYFLNFSNYEKEEPGFTNLFIGEIKGIDINRVYRLISFCQCFTDEPSRKIANEAEALFNCLVLTLFPNRIYDYATGEKTLKQIYNEETTGIKFNTSTPTNKSLYDSQYLATFKTSPGNKIIGGLLRAGIIEEAGEVWKWKASNRLFGYFAIEVCRGDVLDLRPENDKMEWGKIKPLFGVANESFRVFIADNFELKNKYFWKAKPKGSRKIDNIIEEALKDEKERL